MIPRRFLSALSPPRLLLLSIVCGALLLVPTYYVLKPDSPTGTSSIWAPSAVERGGAAGAGGVMRALTGEDKVDRSVLEGGVIMPRLGNETLK